MDPAHFPDSSLAVIKRDCSRNSQRRRISARPDWWTRFGNVSAKFHFSVTST